MLLLALSQLALAGSCPDPTVVAASTTWDGDRAWIHEAGWFQPLTDPGAVPLSGQTAWPADGALLTLRLGDQVRGWPVQAMAYHHVANDLIGEEAVVVTY